jgi:hypothetical protein
MRNTKTIIKGVLDNSIDVKDLSMEELDAVVDKLIDIGESLLDTENHEAGVAILQVLDAVIDLRSHDMDEGFEQAIVAAEQRGATYWEIENPSVH